MSVNETTDENVDAEAPIEVAVVNGVEVSLDVIDPDAKTVQVNDMDDFKLVAGYFGIAVKDKGRPPLKAVATQVLLQNWRIIPTDVFNNGTAVGHGGAALGSVVKDKGPETVYVVTYRKVHNNGGTGPVQTAQLTATQVREHTGEQRGRVGAKRIMVALAKVLDVPLEKLTTAGVGFADAQRDDVPSVALSGTVSELDQTPVPEVIPDAVETDSDAQGHATEDQINDAIAAGERAAVLEAV